MLPASGSGVRPRWFFVLPCVPGINLLCLTLSLHVFAVAARFGGCSVLDFMRAFAGTGPFVRMIVVGFFGVASMTTEHNSRCSNGEKHF